MAAILALTEQILGGATRGTAFALSGIMIARILPTMLLGPVAGVYVDRWDRRRLLIGTDIGRGIIMALVPFSPDIYALFLATLAIEVMSTLFLPAKDALIPRLVNKDQLVQANQLNLIAAYGTLPVGGALFALFTGASLSRAGRPVAVHRRAPRVGADLGQRAELLRLRGVRDADQGAAARWSASAAPWPAAPTGPGRGRSSRRACSSSPATRWCAAW